MSRKNIHLGLTRKIEQYICTIPAGELLPPEQEMSAHFEVSKPTLRLALAPMIEKGFIENNDDSQNGQDFKKFFEIIISDKKIRK